MDIEKVEKVRDYPVKKSNEMVQKIIGVLTAQEFDLLQYLIMQIKDGDCEFKPMEISIHDYCKIANIQVNGRSYGRIKKSLKALRDKSVWIENEGKDTLVAWIDAPIEILKGSGTIRLQLSKFWEPYLLELKQRYTVTTLRETLPMRSVYGKRLYELLVSYLMNRNDSAYVEFTIDELKKKLLGEEWETKHKQFGHFKAKVLTPAMEDIETYGNIKVTMNLEKLGKAYHRVTFGIKYKDTLERLLAAENSNEFFKENTDEND